MVIDRIELRLVRLPLVRTFRTSSSSKSEVTHILVRVEAGGAIGWGECASPADPYYCPETYETCWHILRDFLAPAVIGKGWERIQDLAVLYRLVKGNRFAKAGLEMACWDLVARQAELSLAQMLSGTRAEILSGVSLGIESEISRLYDQIDQYLAEGYRRIKLKIGPGNDVGIVKSVRQRYPGIALQVDANSAYSLDDIDLLRQLDEFGLLLIEQPLAHDDIIDHAKLQAVMHTPICLDESIHSAADARKAIELGACRVINIKVSRVGGLLEAKRVHDVCQAHGVPVWCGGMHEFGIGRAANVAIASLPGFVLPGDVSGSDKYYDEDLVAPPVRASRGAVSVPNGPGLGHEPVLERIEKRTIRRIEITNDGASE
jgi:O-succinylbenzoate synthase